MSGNEWLPARADSLSVGAAARAGGRLSLEEGAGRHERERRAHQTSGQETHDELVDNHGYEFRGGRTSLAPEA